MKPIMRIDLDELIEYRDGLTEIINQYEKFNTDFDAKMEKLKSLGYDLEVAESILNILFDIDEVTDDE